MHSKLRIVVEMIIAASQRKMDYSFRNYFMDQIQVICAMILHNWLIEEEFNSDANILDVENDADGELSQRREAALRKRDALEALINVLLE
jgi:hypothetical protein